MTWVKLPLADDLAKSEQRKEYGVFDTRSIVCFIPSDNNRNECVVHLAVRKKKDKYTLDCSIEDALHLVREAELNEAIDLSLRQGVQE